MPGPVPEPEPGLELDPGPVTEPGREAEPEAGRGVEVEAGRGPEAGGGLQRTLWIIELKQTSSSMKIERGNFILKELEELTSSKFKEQKVFQTNLLIENL